MPRTTCFPGAGKLKRGPTAVLLLVLALLVAADGLASLATGRAAPEPQSTTTTTACRPCSTTSTTRHRPSRAATPRFSPCPACEPQPTCTCNCSGDGKE